MFHPNPNYPLLLSSSDDRSVRVWHVESGACLHVLTPHAGRVRALAVSDDYLLTGADDHTLKVFSLEYNASHTPVDDADDDDDDSPSLYPTTNTANVITNNNDIIPETDDGIVSTQEIATLLNHDHRLYSISFTQDRIVSVAHDDHFIVWEMTCTPTVQSLLKMVRSTINR